MSRVEDWNSSEEFIIRLYNHHFFVLEESKLPIIHDYLNETTKWIELEQENIKKKIGKWKNSEKEEKYPSYDYYESDLLNYNFEFIQLQLNSIFITTFSTFEVYFKSFTKIYQERLNLKISVTDINGTNYLKRSKIYIEKVLDINLSSLNVIWNKISTYQKIRNKIVHNNSFLTTSEKKIIEEINNLNGVIVHGNGKIYLEGKEFIFEFCKIFNEYIKGIIEITDREIEKLLPSKDNK